MCRLEADWKCFSVSPPDVHCCLHRLPWGGSSGAASNYLHVLRRNIDQILLNGETKELHSPARSFLQGSLTTQHQYSDGVDMP